jgi:hypothetical protein
MRSEYNIIDLDNQSEPLNPNTVIKRKLLNSGSTGLGIKG